MFSAYILRFIDLDKYFALLCSILIDTDSALVTYRHRFCISVLNTYQYRFYNPFEQGHPTDLFYKTSVLWEVEQAGRFSEQMNLINQ